MKTCGSCKHFLLETKKSGTCAIKPFRVSRYGDTIMVNGEPFRFYTSCSYKACLKHEEKEKEMRKMSNWLAKGKFDAKDEYYTPPILVKPIIKYIKPNSTVWCPFDTEDSEFVILLKEAGHKVIYSHIWNGQDFFEYEPNERYDYIISNPPFTKKLEVFKRLYALGKPFAMVCGLPILNYQEIGEFFLGKELQLLIVDKKVSFDGNTASFNNSYFCNGILPYDIMFEHLEHNNTKNKFVGSRMKKGE